MLNRCKIVKCLILAIFFTFFVALTRPCYVQDETSAGVQTSGGVSFDLAQAVHEAEEGATVKIPAGTYALRAPLVIEKSLTLEAEGCAPQSEVVIKCDRANAIVISADKVCLRNLHIKLSEKVNVSDSDGAEDIELEVDGANSSGSDDQNKGDFLASLEEEQSSKGKDNDPYHHFAAVKASCGNLTVEKCSIEGEKRVLDQKFMNEQRGLHIAGSSSHLTMKNSQITCLDTGVLIAEGATGIMTDCHFEYNGTAFGILTKCSLECDKIVVTRNATGGVFTNNAKSVVRNSSFTKNWYANMAVMSLGPTKAEELRIEDTDFTYSDEGLIVRGALCFVNNCKFFNHYEEGVSVASSTLQMSQCFFHDNSTGVYANNESKLFMEKCVLKGGRYGVDALDSQINVSESLFSDIGEAICSADSEVSEKNNTFENNVNDVVEL